MNTQTPERIPLNTGIAWEPEGYKEGCWWGHIVTTDDGFAVIRDVSITQAKLMAKYMRPVEASPLPGDGEYWVMGTGIYIPTESRRGKDAILIAECATVEQAHAVKKLLLTREQATAPLREALKQSLAVMNETPMPVSWPQQQRLIDAMRAAESALAAHPTKATTGKRDRPLSEKLDAVGRKPMPYESLNSTPAGKGGGK